MKQKKTKKMKPVKGWAIVEEGKVVNSGCYIPYIRIHKTKPDADLFYVGPKNRKIVRVEIRETSIGEHMNDKEALALYGKRIAPTAEQPASEKKKIAKEVQECLAAKDLDEAVAILLRNKWGRPVECAMKLRGPIPCPACGGTGLI